MFPYHDENKTQRTPVITYGLIGINVLAWLLVQGAGSAYQLAASVCNYGLIPGELTGGAEPGSGFLMADDLACVVDPGPQLHTVITSMFMHGSWMHLLGNMWAQDWSNVYDLLEPGGALALISHEHAERPRPFAPGHLPIPDLHAELPPQIAPGQPPIPHELIRALSRAT